MMVRRVALDQVLLLEGADWKRCVVRTKVYCGASSFNCSRLTRNIPTTISIRETPLKKRSTHWRGPDGPNTTVSGQTGLRMRTRCFFLDRGAFHVVRRSVHHETGKNFAVRVVDTTKLQTSAFLTLEGKNLGSCGSRLSLAARSEQRIHFQDCIVRPAFATL